MRKATLIQQTCIPIVANLAMACIRIVAAAVVAVEALPDKAPINVVADIVLLSGCNVIPSVE